MTVISSAFKENETIPKQYTGFGEDLSPPLIINDIPKETVSIAVIMDDLAVADK